MQGNETVVTSDEGVVHRFHYDHCFWSFDHTQSEFSGQRAIYVSLARPLLDRSFEGYNTCLFAYGQVRTSVMLRSRTRVPREPIVWGTCIVPSPVIESVAIDRCIRIHVLVCSGTAE